MSKRVTQNKRKNPPVNKYATRVVRVVSSGIVTIGMRGTVAQIDAAWAAELVAAGVAIYVDEVTNESNKCI